MSSMEHLSDQQIARVEALGAARDTSRRTGGPFGPVTPVDVPELVDLSEYILRGIHPMDRYADKEADSGDEHA